MKLQLPKEDWKNQDPPSLMSYKANQTLGNTSMEKSDSMKVYIKTQPGKRDSKTVVIYMTPFRTGSTESLLNFVTILNKIIRNQELSTGLQKFGMTRNLVIGEALRVVEKKSE